MKVKVYHQEWHSGETDTYLTQPHHLRNNRNYANIELLSFNEKFPIQFVEEIHSKTAVFKQRPIMEEVWEDGFKPDANTSPSALRDKIVTKEIGLTDPTEDKEFKEWIKKIGATSWEIIGMADNQVRYRAFMPQTVGYVELPESGEELLQILLEFSIDFNKEKDQIEIILG